MLFVIPSAGRARRMVTLRSLKIAGVLDRTILVVPKAQVQSYENNVQGVFDKVTIIGLGEEHAGIAKTREWILTQMPMRGHRYVAMFDDDMDFCWRPDCENSPALETIKDQHRMVELLDTMTSWLALGFVHVGLTARQGNNNQFKNDAGVTGWWRYRDATRMMNAYAYDVKALAALIERGIVTLGRVPVMEDFDLTLQLLRAGYANRVSYEYCWNQRLSGAEGGCSTYRTGEMQAAAATTLAELHPGFVKVVEKNSASQKGAMAQRIDVNVQWRKAYDSAPIKHKNGPPGVPVQEVES